MRKIKFKGWDGKKMTREYTLYEMLSLQLPNNGLKHNWLQYTGLKDKNGKEIYEGDIIPIVIEDLGRSIKTANGVVKFKRGQWNIEYFHPFQKEMYISNLYRLLERKEKEVLGNIYENPELLDIK